MKIKDWSPAEWEMLEGLLRAQRIANSLDGYHARQNGGTYGALTDALLTGIACSIVSAQTLHFPVAREVARRLYDEAIDNGEGLRWQVDLWNEGVIR